MSDDDEARAQARGMPLQEYREWRARLRNDYRVMFPPSKGRAIVTALLLWPAEER